MLRVRTALRIVAALLAAAAAIAWASGGIRLDLGPLHVSATDPWRVFFEAAGAWLVAELLAPGDRTVLAAMLPIVAVLAAGVAESSPRRVGDGAEYMVMAMNLGHGRPPSLSPDNATEAAARLRATPGFDDMEVGKNLPQGTDGRRDTYHFWLYPLLAAPLLALAGLVHVHANYAFTAVNLLLLGWLARDLIDRERFDIAAAVCVGPVLWWIDKAHAEVFLFVTLASAVLFIDRRPGLALLAAAAATAQNSGAVVVLALCVAAVVLARRTGEVGAPMRVVVGGLALLAPAYYWWHLGTPSPLLQTLAPGLPGARELLTPLVDLNLGLLPYAPLLSLLAVIGIVSAPRRTAGLCIAAALALLVVFAQSANVNHGGSPGMSRYALWLVAVAVPLITAGSARLRVRHPTVHSLVLATSVALSMLLFRPDWPDRGGVSPNALARLAWTDVPAFDNPLPEVFSERMSERDGQPALPVATPGCAKVLTIGDGSTAWWPFPCTPGEAPPMCTTANALCFVNAGAFTLAPRQRHFEYTVAKEHAWSVHDRRGLDAVLHLLGATPRHVSIAESRLHDRGTAGVEPVYLVEGSAAVAVWARAMSAPTYEPRLRLGIDRPSTVTLLDVASLLPIAPPVTVAGGIYELAMRPGAEQLLVVSDQR